jgi:hypothetical protein
MSGRFAVRAELPYEWEGRRLERARIRCQGGIWVAGGGGAGGFACEVDSKLVCAFTIAAAGDVRTPGIGQIAPWQYSALAGLTLFSTREAGQQTGFLPSANEVDYGSLFL